MIDKQTLKKHNLKAVPFSCIGEGETFNVDGDFSSALQNDPFFYTRRLKGCRVIYDDESCPTFIKLRDYLKSTVYVPVDRVTN